ncbi:MAG TPA: TIGR01777 family oxidoreductase [Pseudonocardiaceae bacterium]|nr:TIGR01777 family oxidoreductase [Pseudonocardiaceae bacterium]
MRVVVAGSSGFIGTALVAALRRAGHEVTRLVRREAAAADERQWDPPAGRLEPDALAGVDVVVNLCGVGVADKRWTAERKQAIRDSRFTPTEVLAGAVASNGVRALVNASAVGFYGDTGDALVDESAPVGKGFLATLCEEWERSTAAAAEAGARVVLLRTGLVLSGHGGLLPPLRTVFSLYLGARLGSGRQYMPWISFDDEIAAIRFAVEHDTLAGPVNLTGPAPVTNAEFTKALGDALHRPTPWMVPGFVLRAALGELADEGVLAGQRAVPRALERAGFRFTHQSLREALDAVA